MRLRPTLALFAAALLALAGCRRQAPEGLALVNATVYDGLSPRLRHDVTIIIRRDSIAAIGHKAVVEVPKGMPTVDLAGKYVIPGLIDGHVHVAPWTLPRFLAFGVTSVRDVHGTLDSVMHWRERVNLNAVAGPRLYVAGAMIDAAPGTYPDALVVEDATAARKAVDKLAVAGVDYVKVYTRLDTTLLHAVLDEAKTFGLKVTGHLGRVTATQAGALGIAALEHLSGVPEAARPDPALLEAHARGFFAGWTAFERAWPALDSASLAAVARTLAEEKVTLVPTLVLHETFSRIDDPALARAPALAAVPDSEITKWNVPDMVRRAGWTKADLAAFRDARANQDLFVRLFHAAGGRIVAGSDAANQMLVPGESLQHELELLVQAGLQPVEALAAATHDAAALLGADSIGTLQVGRKADLVILGGDPVTDIRNVRRVEQVMTRGHLFSADSIRRSW